MRRQGHCCFVSAGDAAGHQPRGKSTTIDQKEPPTKESDTPAGQTPTKEASAKATVADFPGWEPDPPSPATQKPGNIPADQRHSGW